MMPLKVQCSQRYFSERIKNAGKAMKGHAGEGVILAELFMNNGKMLCFVA